jgi:hypothetical protein
MKKQSFIKADRQLRLIDVKLSSNPEAMVEDDKNGVNGKINVASDGRKYYIAEFADPDNPFNPSRTRVISQNTGTGGINVWRVPAPKAMLAFKGKNIPADIVTQFVEPYTIGDRVMDVYTTVVFRHEIVEHVFARAGHQIVGVEIEDTVQVGADNFGEMN